MQIIKEDTLINIINNIQNYDDELILYINDKDGDNKDEWHSESIVSALQFEDDESIDLKIGDLFYFLEIDLVKEVIEGWVEGNDFKNDSPQEKCEAVIYYAINDAYKEPV